MNFQALRWQDRRPNVVTDRFVSRVGIVVILAIAPELLGATLLGGLILGTYFVSLIVAFCRGHRNELAIGVLTCCWDGRSSVGLQRSSGLAQPTSAAVLRPMPRS